MAGLEVEPISTLAEPLLLPDYRFDARLSEDDNMLTWVSILARHSSSKKGHMGAIFVSPPAKGDPSLTATTTESSSCQPAISERIRAYANNTPLLYSKNVKAVPEIHAEALAISRSAAQGVKLQGCTVYITFPPCNACFKLLIAAGIKRCVYKKGVLMGKGQGEAVLVAAEAHGIEMRGTLDQANQLRMKGKTKEEAEAKRREKIKEDAMEARVRAFWVEKGEDAVKTRGRVARWWEDWKRRYGAAEKVLNARWGITSHQRETKFVEDLDEIRNESTSTIPEKRSSEEESSLQQNNKEAKVEA